MLSTVKRLEVTYKPVNDSNSFTNGDIVAGEVTLEAAKDFQIGSLFIKFKGKAEVRWTERHGKTTHVYHAKDKYFSVRHYFILDKNGKGNDRQTLVTNENSQTYCSVVAPGCHVYPFSFQIPFQDLPSSFSGADGKIVYLLEAVLSRSMRIDTKHSTKINFVSRTNMNTVTWLQTPQHESKDKKIFTSGSVAMDVNLEKMGFHQGEGLKVVAFIKNSSSREVKLKYCVYRKHSFFARGKRRLHTNDLLKEVGDPIPPSAEETVTRVITIPHDLEPSVLNCNIIKVEHRLRVYLDVKYASDPEIKFPIVILPAFQASAALPPPPAAAATAPPAAPPFSSGFNPNPPVWGYGPQPQQPPVVPNPSESPPPYGAYAMYPSLTDFDKKY
ncbi:arrestin domain-containing protein 3-like [Archocentrus centrarchus]|uniref:arrestin domain-containing protein 3-like n=1 Tax=Archocentrus centrarchus TaxID=63155 RepID=UPI0011EA42BD|nr:arrestin domain-containing protein 3-like [Archocentrus centrarchus]